MQSLHCRQQAFPSAWNYEGRYLTRQEMEGSEAVWEPHVTSCQWSSAETSKRTAFNVLLWLVNSGCVCNTLDTQISMAFYFECWKIQVKITLQKFHLQCNQRLLWFYWTLCFLLQETYTEWSSPWEDPVNCSELCFSAARNNSCLHTVMHLLETAFVRHQIHIMN